ncbi:hydroxymethylbilane synthase [Roseomonas sp. 18066]|uniref:hydroxymethylbilane synthase n=1 Tax=Roseomonas sp. 18066 TaxID=2681412 RepID=UPI0013597A18|nr:hydroxymethylbilane synthase [Roseomonas sp. 18066]
MSAALQPAALAFPFRAGTRASPLALAQTRLVLQALGLPGAAVPLSTSGDAEQRRSLAALGGKGLFAKEIHEALLDGRVDFAVHSLKDLETELPAGLVIAAHLPREDPRDALILAPGIPPEEHALPFPTLPIGARVGTASARRMAQLRQARPDLRFGLLRGNVQTRLARLASGDFCATLLAMAGLNRLGLCQGDSVALTLEDMVPAAGQGIIAVTARAGDSATLAMLAAIDHRPTRLAATAERAMLAALDGSCRTPIGALARLLPDGRLSVTGLVARADGSFLARRSLSGAPADAARLGLTLGDLLRADSPADLFA